MSHQDLVTLVTEEDIVLGTMDKIEAHRGEGKLHRAISVFLFRKNSVDKVELLVQKRSDKKIVGAGQWANTVCGNVCPDESYEDCAKRRLSFELGITETGKLEDVTTFRYQAKCNQEFSENEIVHIFAGWFKGELNHNPDEVSDTRWIEWGSIDVNKLNATPWFLLFMGNKSIVNGMDTYVSR